MNVLKSELLYMQCLQVCHYKAAGSYRLDADTSHAMGCSQWIEVICSCIMVAKHSA